MLSESLLIWTGVTVSIVGTLLLFLILQSAALPLEQLSVVELERVDATVRVQGEVLSVRHAANGTITLLTLAEEVERHAVIFDPVNVTEGMRVEAIGEVQEYREEPELVIRQLVSLP